MWVFKYKLHACKKSPCPGRVSWWPRRLTQMLLGDEHRFISVHISSHLRHMQLRVLNGKREGTIVPLAMWNLLAWTATTTPQVFCNSLCGDHGLHDSRTDDKGQGYIDLEKPSSNNHNSNSNSRLGCLPNRHHLTFLPCKQIPDFVLR